jgi:hypothetical protein
MSEIAFPKHIDLILEHNPHVSDGVTVAEHIRNLSDYYHDDVWATETSREQEIDTNDLWCLQWYPITPIGFYVVAGATWKEVVAAVNIEPANIELPEHISLTLEHNPHNGFYETVAEYLRNSPFKHAWAMWSSKQRAINTSELWTLRWHPKSLTRESRVVGATLEEVIKEAKNEPRQG